MPWALCTLGWGRDVHVFAPAGGCGQGLLERQRWGKGGSNALPEQARAPDSLAERSARSKCLLTMVLLPLLYKRAAPCRQRYPGFGLLRRSLHNNGS